MPASETIDESGLVKGPADLPKPGVLVVWSADRPALRAIPLRHGRLLLGREHGDLHDERLSRKHAEIELEAGRWSVRDLESRNGTWVDGKKLQAAISLESPKVIRMGRTLLLVAHDIRAFEGAAVEQTNEMVVGPTLRRALEAIVRAAAQGEHLLVTGETGTGKERAAKLFHASGPNASGPLVAVNCATIPEGVAERLLFGARRGAYSGADNAEGYVSAANGGVLFLDELGELDLDVQAKLLRVLETREVTPLGATSSKKVDVRYCLATHRELRASVAKGRFRADLYHRIVHPEVTLPPLRNRREEIPWLIAYELSRIDPTLSAHIGFVEACLARPWPGNVRELLQQVRRAASSTTESKTIVADALDPHAGLPFEEEGEEAGEDRPAPTREVIEETLKSQGNNVAATARALGLHRTQLYRLFRRFGLKAE
jgi:transcriptional regulator with PAS, ATPase and Fis domain